LKNSYDISINEEELTNLLNYVNRLRPIVEKAYKLHEKGLQRDELIELLNNVEDLLKHKIGREDLVILERLKTLKEIITYLPSFLFPLHPRKCIERLSHILENLPSLPRPGILISKPHDIAKLLQELDEFIGLLVDDLYRYTRVISLLLDTLKPEVIPLLIEFVSKNPGHIRTTLGEALCIWWFTRILGRVEGKEYWSRARGSFVISRVEVDVVSVKCEGKLCEYAVAEVKISRSEDELNDAIRQLISAAQIFKLPENIQLISKYEMKPTKCECREAALATLYNIKELKNKIKERLKLELRNLGLECNAEVYDINDILENIRGLRENVKHRYRELFKVINKILEVA